MHYLRKLALPACGALFPRSTAPPPRGACSPNTKVVKEPAKSSFAQRKRRSSRGAKADDERPENQAATKPWNGLSVEEFVRIPALPRLIGRGPSAATRLTFIYYIFYYVVVQINVQKNRNKFPRSLGAASRSGMGETAGNRGYRSGIRENAVNWPTPSARQGPIRRMGQLRLRPYRHRNSLRPAAARRLTEPLIRAFRLLATYFGRCDRRAPVRYGRGMRPEQIDAPPST